MINNRQINPLLVSTAIREDYERYLETAFPIKDSNLRGQFKELIRQKNFLTRGPYLEMTPPFRNGRNLRQMSDSGVLCQSMLDLDGPGFPDYGYPIDRHLYLHQDQAVTKLRNGRNIVVATGTGSGKTESFLIPILDHLLREHESGTLNRPGVRALLLYPMNALANDQLKRLRRLLLKIPAITFGRYTGQTLENQKDAEQDFRQVFPNEPRIENELISRDAIRAQPPHILLTNYAMLEYLLLRPKDTSLFDGDFGGNWSFLVLDEAHSYSGAAGMEVGMLLRRLKERVVKSRPGALQCIATSATLGRGREDFPLVSSFAEALFGERFEWNENDIAWQDIIEPSLVDDSDTIETWGAPNSEIYADLQKHKDDLQTAAYIARKHGVPEDVVDKAISEARGSAGVFLYRLLQTDGRVQSLKKFLKSRPATLEAAAAEFDAFGTTDEGHEAVLVSLVSLCTQAKPANDSAPLISARYHFFCRALEGAYITFPKGKPPQLYLTPLVHAHDNNESFKAFEIATCTRCGQTMLAGKLIDVPLDHDNDKSIFHGQYFSPLPQHDDNELASGKIFLSWAVPLETSIDEDEAALADIEPVLLSPNPGILCTICGAYERGMEKPGCACDSVRHLIVYEASLKDGKLRTCPTCGAQTKYGDAVNRFYTGQDAPVAVLASSLYQHISPEPISGHPGGNRKLLAFSDSRQDAAYFAPYLETTHRKLLQRRLILQALIEHGKKYEFNPARPHGLADTFLRELSHKLKIFPAPNDTARENKERCSWIFQELLTLDRRSSLEGTALLDVRYTKPSEWTMPDALLKNQWNFNDDELWRLVGVLLDTVRFSGCLSIEPADIFAPEFEPRNRMVYCHEIGVNHAKGMTVLGWLPKRDEREFVTNRRFDFLSRLMEKRTSQPVEPATIMKTLREVWRSLTVTPLMKSVLLENIGSVYHLNPEYVEMHVGNAADVEWRRCSACQTVSAATIGSICPTMRCSGEMLPFDPERDLADHHYRRLYLGMNPAPMKVFEHTAQWGARKAADIQQKFMDGIVNVLSCSTTFELGVDVGELQTVLMRNVPPSTANYVQRAGRAGRRTGSAAFALTYAQRRPHDLTHFAHPEDIIGGKIKPPAVEIHNPKIVRRHVHSVVLADFFRRYPHTFENVEAFFCQDDGNSIATTLLDEMLKEQPAQLLSSLLNIIPNDPDIRNELKLDNWGWVPGLIHVEQNGRFNGALGMAAEEVLSDLDEYQKLEDEAGKAKKYSSAGAFQRQANNIRRRQLLGFLASRNVLPKYGFPVDVVELRLKPSTDVSQELVLERDLRIAISEYAPGGEIVAGHRLWKSTGIRRLPGRDPLEAAYCICPQCHRFHGCIQREDLPKTCQACGAEMRGRGFRSGLMVKPEFGFFSNLDSERVGASRPQRLHSSRVYFSEYASDEGLKEKYKSYQKDIRNSRQEQLMYRFSRQGKLVVVNSGKANRGFLICQSCGYAETAALKARKSDREHRNAFDRPCRGRLETRHLGHEFLTDVLELRFLAIAPYDPERSTWWSLLYALLLGASEELGIERRDIDGCLYPYGERTRPPAIVLFDNIPGGAGHVRRIGENLQDVLEKTYQLADGCQSCDEETACYGCLKTYDNQFCHHMLQRGPVSKFLMGFFDAAT